MPLKMLLRVAGLSALLHAYIGFRLLPDLALGAAGTAAAIAYLALSVLLMPAPLLARSAVHRPWMELLAWLGYLAMGLFSSLFVLTLLRDVLLLALVVVGMLSPSVVSIDGFREASAIAVAGLALLLTLVGVVNARRLARVVRVDIPIAGLPAALSGFVIVQISDIHVGSTIKRGYLSAIVGAVNALKPDLVAVTGDLVDGSVERLGPHVAPLASLSARHGVYFVTGNHEYYSGADAWVAELRRLGLNVLMNQNAVLEHDGARLLVGGVTDYSAHHFDPAQRSDPRAALSGAPADIAVRLLLAHQPRSAPAAEEAGFDVQLSGHTHGGQFLPWNFFVRFQQPFTAGLNRLKKLWVYTSRGTGYWGPPVRFGAPSEITRLRLVTA
ncbi:MAG: Ser/Thr protein phosphatase family protein [Nevskia sp.]|nr:Ser/Thr protein phosphatase family protein [Nevskia sp.]